MNEIAKCPQIMTNVIPNRLKMYQNRSILKNITETGITVQHIVFVPFITIF
jgi:hypothetical protein